MVGLIFFLPKKGPTGPVSAGPAGSRRDHAGAKARRAAPAPRRARAAKASCLYAASAPSVMNAIDGDDGRLADDRRRSQSTRKRLSHPAPPERVVQILQERPRVVHVRPAQHDLDSTFVAASS